MKVMFIPARASVDVSLSDTALMSLPDKKYGVLTTVQHEDSIKSVLRQLDSAVYCGIVTGCRADGVIKNRNKVDAFLYVGTGDFHPIRIVLDSGGKDVYCYDPLAKKVTKMSKNIVADYKKRVKGQLLRFWHSNKIGLLVTTKPGQNAGIITPYSLKAKMGLPMKFMSRNDGKKYYLFAVETLNHTFLEDFSFIDCWVNFACNRIADDDNDNIVNATDIIEAEHAR